MQVMLAADVARTKLIKVPTPTNFSANKKRTK